VRVGNTDALYRRIETEEGFFKRSGGDLCVDSIGDRALVGDDEPTGLLEALDDRVRIQGYNERASITSTLTSPSRASAVDSDSPTSRWVATTVTSSPSRSTCADPMGTVKSLSDRYLTFLLVDHLVLEEEHGGRSSEWPTWRSPFAAAGVPGATALMPGKCANHV